MDNPENKITPAESLQLIESMINRARDKFNENGHLYLLWGWVILICSVFHFVAWHFSLFPRPQVVWMLTWLAAIYQTIYLIKKKKERRVKTYTDDILANVWTVFIVCMFLMVFVMVKKEAYDKAYPMLLVLYGMPTFLSGKILKVKALSVGGVCCWILAIAATFITLKYQLLLIGLAVISAWIIPGYTMQSKFKNQQ